MVRISKITYEKCRVNVKKYRRSYLYNVILKKIEKDHGMTITVNFKSDPDTSIVLTENALREFIWLLRSKEAEDNIDIWVSRTLARVQMRKAALIKE